MWGQNEFSLTECCNSGFFLPHTIIKTGLSAQSRINTLSQRCLILSKIWPGKQTIMHTLDKQVTPCRSVTELTKPKS